MSNSTVIKQLKRLHIFVMLLEIVKNDRVNCPGLDNDLQLDDHIKVNKNIWKKWLRTLVFVYVIVLNMYYNTCEFHVSEYFILGMQAGRVNCPVFATAAGVCDPCPEVAENFKIRKSLWRKHIWTLVHLIYCSIWLGL